MGTDPELDTERTVVQVYVPAYQRDVWDEHADELDMNRSEFVKAMVQAGRRGFGGEPAVEAGTEADDVSGDDAAEADLPAQVIASLSEHECLSWDELLVEVTGDIEARLEETLQELQEHGTVRYSGRAGGYILDSEDP